MRHINAVFLDHDGTLGDSVDAVYNSAMYVLRMSGIPQISLHEFFEGLTVPFQDFLRGLGVTAPLEQVLDWYYLAAKNSVTTLLFSDVQPVLNQLHQSGVVLGVISANSEEILQKHLSEGGVINLFSEIHSDIQGKIETIRECALRHGNLEQSFYVGDFPSDMRDGVQAGVIPVGITRRYQTADLLRRNGAKFVIENLYELLPLVS